MRRYFLFNSIDEAYWHFGNEEIVAEYNLDDVIRDNKKHMLDCYGIHEDNVYEYVSGQKYTETVYNFIEKNNDGLSLRITSRVCGFEDNVDKVRVFKILARYGEYTNKSAEYKICSTDVDIDTVIDSIYDELGLNRIETEMCGDVDKNSVRYEYSSESSVIFVIYKDYNLTDTSDELKIFTVDYPDESYSSIVAAKDKNEAIWLIASVYPEFDDTKMKVDEIYINKPRVISERYE